VKNGQKCKEEEELTLVSCVKTHRSDAQVLQKRTG